MQRAPATALLSLSRRGYAAAAAGAEIQQRAPAAMAARVSGSEGGNNAAASPEIFWIPQDRFADVDAAELRARLIGRKN
ncbi:hypothetical protein QOZ80_2BG0189850 [Eleusine coracana subsp. coracana]|nr:hypothetical protein QOZ80_2BG0189850 [Eleusine coracana subsp. coracana]